MGKLEEFKILFDHPQGVHFAGQWLRGSVRVVLHEPMKMRGITINLVGRAKVHWHTYHNKNRKDYRSEEVYFDETFQLYGTGQEATLSAGDYDYPFEFLLLRDLPSSFEGEYGYVRYMARATIDRPWKFDHVAKEPFTVLGCVDLNKEPGNWKEPYLMSEEKTVSCCCCTSGTVDAEITINKRCFVPGETIYINGEINNRTNSTVSRARCALKQYIQFMAPSTCLFSSGEMHTKEVTSYEVKVEGEEIKKGQTDVWSNVPLVIPALPPSRLEGCGIINIIYVFKFYVDAGYSDFKMETPIIIGTVPLRETLDAFNLLQPAHAITAQPYAPPAIDEMIEAPPAYSSLLPSYEECVMGRVDIRDEKDSEHVRGSHVWAPLYTTYQFPNSTAMLPMHISEKPIYEEPVV